MGMLLRPLLQALQTDGVEIAIDRGIEEMRCNRFALHDLLERLHHIRRLKRRTTRDQTIEGGSQGIDIGKRADLFVLALGLFRRHVTGRAHDLPGLSQTAIRVGALCQTKIGDARLTGGVEHDVARLQIAVNHSL